MPKSKASSTTDTSRRTGRREIIGLGLLAFSVLLGLSLISYRPHDISVIQSPPNQPTANIIGLAGAWSAYLLFLLLGLAGYVLPVVLAAQGVLCLAGDEHVPGLKLGHKLGWMGLLLLCAACLLELMHTPVSRMASELNLAFAGGAVGHLLGSLVLIRLMGEIGTGILIAFLVLIAAVCLFDFEIAPFFRDPKGTLGPLWQKMLLLLSPGGTGREEDDDSIESVVVEKPSKKRKKRKEPEPEPDPLADPLFPEPVAPLDWDEPVSESVPPPEPPAPVPPKAEPSIFKRSANAAPKAKVSPASAASEDTGEVFDADVDSGTGQVWKLPPISFLQEVTGGVVPDAARDEFLRQLLERTLNEFGVEAKITEVNRGPVVTSFEVLPAPGVRVEKIAGLSNNLALALKAESIRVQAPIPGKGVVGIEVPNNKTSVVFARQIIGGPEWEKAKDWRRGKIALPLCLGVDVSGNTLVGDLADMPHLLIAGATGSGKSVCMNSLLAGLLMSRTPDQLRLILVDPKIVEFTAYRDLPHLVVPVITDPKKVGLGLRWAITEMEKRYKLFAKVGVRNIRGYNTRVVAKQGDLFGVDDEPKEKHPETLPYIVVVIDELADLMMVAQAEIENYIARLAQLSRAVGIHMILATQRPSVNVITGTIKANFPSRIAFQVAQKTDSRTILDAIGADKLLGKGDMLFLAPSSAKLQRAQGAWTSDEEIGQIVDFIKAQGSPDYENKVTEKLTSSAPELPAQDEDDDLIEQAVEVIRQTRRASTSSLQRRLRIGYNRAARLMDQLEEKGVIGPPQGSDPREILIDLDGEVPQNDTDLGSQPDVDS
ncbi:MAG: DNA translocase FtsK 4TM domain-containing protein [Verrucomicrobia bacterium]|nr:DNA translocase FtsK 4TM domain-containing protein [Verrucomicrobiota bacterium]MCH8526449.1 DNA translocase FtsK [Kiritimatiellia bacterium]